MKKLTLTFCALFVSLALAPALYPGTEKYSGKEKEMLQPAPAPCELYRAHEWDLDLWGSFEFSANPGRFHPDSNDSDPFFPDIDPISFDTTQLTFFESATLNPNERVNVGRVSKDQLMARDNTWGGGIDLKYFWSRYFGAGIEGVGIAAKTNFAGGELGTLTLRYPWWRFAPYGWGGIGAVEGGGALYRFFKEDHDNIINGQIAPATPGHPGETERFVVDFVPNRHVRGLGQLGAGLEFRVSCHVGLMLDFSWNFVFGTEDHADRIEVKHSPGGGIFGVPQSSAIDIHPGATSDNQDFGMARFGVTFSY